MELKVTIRKLSWLPGLGTWLGLIFESQNPIFSPCLIPGSIQHPAFPDPSSQLKDWHLLGQLSRPVMYPQTANSRCGREGGCRSCFCGLCSYWPKFILRRKKNRKRKKLPQVTLTCWRKCWGAEMLNWGLWNAVCFNWMFKLAASRPTTGSF